MDPKKVLVVGSGAREHCIIWKIKQSPLLDCVYTTNKNFEEFATYIDIDLENHFLLAHACKERKIDLVVIGQENYLAAGMSDVLRSEGINVFGPSKNATKLESSKFFAKELCKAYSIPTAQYGHFTQQEEAEKYIEEVGAPLVVKADGLASGKGVFICKSKEEAKAAAEELLVKKRFGQSGASIIIEEFLDGKELSYFALIDQNTVLPLAHARDHKQITKDGKIYNTGGMGAFSPVEIEEETEKQIMRQIIYPTVNGMLSLNVPYTGVLFVGIMLTKSGPKVLEYNVRFGDPETQAILPRLKTDLLDLMLKTTESNLRKAKIELHDCYCLSLVIANNGYPLGYNTGSVIENTDKAIAQVEDLKIFNAGMSKDAKGNILSDGGRVMNLVATGKNLEECKKNVYKAAKIIDWKDGFYIKDIGE